MSDTAIESAPQPENPSGSPQSYPTIAYLHGYLPVIAFGQEEDGTIELGFFSGFEYHPPGDISVAVRGPKPSHLLPAPPETDRVAELEAQIAELQAMMKGFALGQQSQQQAQAPETSSVPTDAATVTSGSTATDTGVAGLPAAGGQTEPDADDAAATSSAAQATPTP